MLLEILLQVLLLVVGFILLVKGADFFVDGVSDIAAHFGIPQIVIGLTIVAFGTSAPEAAISITAAIQGSGGVAIGNIIGSNIMNVWLILGISAIVSPMLVQKNTIRYEIPFTILASTALLVMGILNDDLYIVCGIILWVMFLIFMAYLVFSAVKQMKENKAKGLEKQEEKEKINVPFNIVVSILGGAAVVLGANVSVDAATEIARICEISEDIIGLTIVAFGTSLPELVTSVTASRKGKNDIAIGNIVGSNIFNILFVIGTTSLITPVAFDNSFIADGAVAIAAIVTLWVFTIRKKQLSRAGGIAMLLLYVAYFAYLIARETIL
ncbi:MAG: calcium/sodium antiporter [Ruminococcus sp.]|nr:calcium/sodium antiporter [Ruminococcus sp.]